MSGWSCARLGGGRFEQGLEIPTPSRGAHQVEAGLIHADLADLQMSAPKGKEPDGGGDRAGMEKRLAAELGIFVDGEVVENKTWPGQQAHAHLRKAHRPSQRGRHEAGDARLVSADRDQGRHQQHSQDDHER